MQSDTKVDVSIVVDGDRDGGVAHGAALLAFTDAVMTIDASRIREARAHLVGVAGERAMIDAAAVAAMFQLNTRAADAAGIPIEEPTLEGRAVMGERLGFSPRAEGKAP